jgi:hypothetical protein
MPVPLIPINPASVAASSRVAPVFALVYSSSALSIVIPKAWAICLAVIEAISCFANPDSIILA